MIPPEQPITIAADAGLDATGLEARLCRVGSDLAIIAAPHPLMGGSIDNPVVDALVEGFNAGGLSTLRFNYRGVGSSGGVASGAIADAVADYQRVVRWARTQSFDWLTFAGYSFGALAAIETHVGGFDCHCVAAVAPPTDSLQTAQMGKLDCMFALIYGDADRLINRTRCTELTTYVPFGQVSLIASADHFFTGHLDEIVKYATDIAVYLKTARNAPPDLGDDDEEC